MNNKMPDPFGESFAIIEIGSNNTKTHVYSGEELVYEKNTTIQFKKDYQLKKVVDRLNVEALFREIETARNYTKNLFVFGCSFFRNLPAVELDALNRELNQNFNVEIEVVPQEDEARYTAEGCYKNINCDKSLCIFIGGGGSVELIKVVDGKVCAKKYFDFGVVDVTDKFESLKDDKPSCTFEEVTSYVSSLIGDIGFNADVLILAGGDHPYWYANAGFDLLPNTLYDHPKQKFMLTANLSDQYDRQCFDKSLDEIRLNSSDPKWFNFARAMKMITYCIFHKIGAKYIVPTKINMEDGIKSKIEDFYKRG